MASSTLRLRSDGSGGAGGGGGGGGAGGDGWMETSRHVPDVAGGGDDGGCGGWVQPSVITSGASSISLVVSEEMHPPLA